MVILAILGFGGLIIYIICAIIMPLDTDVDNVQKKDDRW
jgi:phage shock protein PspC (stress-responsive transcriptional regulator)